MNHRNTTSKHRTSTDSETSMSSSDSSENKSVDNKKTRKKREELSVFACKCIKKEDVKIVVTFH